MPGSSYAKDFTLLAFPSCELRSRFNWLPTFVFSFKRCGPAGLHVVCISSLNWKSFLRLFHVHFQEVGSTSEAYIFGDGLVTIITVSGTSANCHFSLELCSCVDSIINLMSGVTDTINSHK